MSIQNFNKETQEVLLEIKKDNLKSKLGNHHWFKFGEEFKEDQILELKKFMAEKNGDIFKDVNVNVYIMSSHNAR